MYYYVSKLVWFVLEPTNLLTLLILGGLLLGRRWLIGCGSVGLIVCGLSPLSVLLYRPLEDRFPAFVDDGRPVHGIVVLGGAAAAQVMNARRQLTLSEAGERITAMAELAQTYPEAAIVFTGGSGDLTASNLSEAAMLEQHAASLIPVKRILFERDSRNTVENAEFTTRMVRPKPGERWLLVTSASHMPRSVGIFRKAGWTVTPYPVDYQSTGGADDFRMQQSVARGLRFTDLVVKEYVGLLFAWLTGKSSALFPAPEAAR